MMKLEQFKKDYSIWILLLTNVLLIILATSGIINRVVFAFSLVYQTIIIGLVSLFDIIAQKKEEGLEAYSHPATKPLWILLLIIAYAMIISWIVATISESGMGAELTKNSATIVMITTIGFLIAYVIEYIQSKNKTLDLKEIRKKKFRPYLRILPIAIIAPILSSSGKGSLIALIVLTTIAEVILHAVTSSKNYSKHTNQKG